MDSWGLFLNFPLGLPSFISDWGLWPTMRAPRKAASNRRRASSSEYWPSTFFGIGGTYDLDRTEHAGSAALSLLHRKVHAFRPSRLVREGKIKGGKHPRSRFDHLGRDFNFDFRRAIPGCGEAICYILHHVVSTR